MNEHSDDTIEDDTRPSEEVGYARPPRASQFQPGKSGNPRGRPKGAKGLKAELKAELDEWVTITTNGKSQRIRKRRLIIKALAAKAAKGEVAAADKLISLVIQAEGFEDQRTEKRTLNDTDKLTLSQFLQPVEAVVTEVESGLPRPTSDNEPSSLARPDTEVGDA